MSDFGSLLAWLGLMAVLSLMDAMARRKRRQQALGEGPESTRQEPAPAETSMMRERPRPARPQRAPLPSRSRAPSTRRPSEPAELPPPEVTPEWAEVRRRLEEMGVVVAQETAGAPDESREPERPTSPPEAVPAPPPSSERPPLIVAAEAIRERRRREMAEAVAPPIQSAGPAVPASAPVRRPDRGVAVHGADLRALLRGDPDAVRRAVLYREVLGPPLGSRPTAGGWESI